SPAGKTSSHLRSGSGHRGPRRQPEQSPACPVHHAPLADAVSAAPMTALPACHPACCPVQPQSPQNSRAYGHDPGTDRSAGACIQNGSPMGAGGTGYAPMGAGGTGYALTGAGGTGYAAGYAPMGAVGIWYAPTGGGGTRYAPTGAGGTGYAPTGEDGTGYAPMGAGGTGYALTGAGGTEYVTGYAPMGAGGIWYAPTGAGGIGDAPRGAWVITVITHSPLTSAKSRKARPVIFPRDFSRKPSGHFRRVLPSS